MSDTEGPTGTALFDRPQAARPRRGGTEAAFRAAVEERLRNLESEVGDVKTRLNGLLFFIASTVIAQVVLRLWS